MSSKQSREDRAKKPCREKRRQSQEDSAERREGRAKNAVPREEKAEPRRQCREKRRQSQEDSAERREDRAKKTGPREDSAQKREDRVKKSGFQSLTLTLHYPFFAWSLTLTRTPNSNPNPEPEPELEPRTLTTQFCPRDFYCSLVKNEGKEFSIPRYQMKMEVNDMSVLITQEVT